MSQLTNIPLQDNYKSTLSQAWDGNVWTIYVNTVPSFTFPSWVKTYICVDPWKANMQVARISAYDATLKTITVDNITIDKWNGVAYTAQTHTVWAVIEISDNYQFREDILTALNTKVNSDWDSTITSGNLTFAWDTAKFWIAVKELTTTQKNALSSPPNWTSLIDSTLWAFQVMVWWSFQSMGAWSTTPNASTTLAGKTEKATPTQVTNWTATGETGAELFVWPAELKTVTDWLTTAINAKPSIATNATASTGSNTTDSVNPLQLKRYFWPEPSAGTTYTASSASGGLWSTSWTTYLQARIWTILRTGTYTVTFDLWAWLTVNGYWRIYKNGVAFWTERVVTNTTTTFAENLAFTEWDTISLWYKSNWAWSATVSNLYIQYTQTNQINFTLA